MTYSYTEHQYLTSLLENLTEWQWATITNYTYEGQKCMLEFWFSPEPEGSYCNATWDQYKCWTATPANTTVLQPCPDHSNINVTVPDAVAHRTCDVTGNWVHGSWTNYTECVANIIGLIPSDTYPNCLYPDDCDFGDVWKAVVLRDIYFYGSILSFVLLVVTFFIFTFFKSLHCNRISIHKNLVLSFIVRSVIFIIFFEPFVSGREYSYRDIDWLCKLLTSILYYTLIANIFWMFVEGLFLHNRVAISVFNTEAPFPIFYLVGWGSPGLIVLAWAICMHEFNPQKCWNGSYKLHYMWIIILPVLLAITVNTVFLVNIIRILVTKLRANNTVELDRVRKAVKATAILFPLLGMTHILFFFRPKELNEAWEMAYRITHAIFQASQGVFVSVIYCFMNSEVRMAVLKKWQRYQSRRLGEGKGRRRSSTGRTSTFLLPGGEKSTSCTVESSHPWTTIV